MNHVLSLISAPAANAVDAPLLQALANALAGSPCPLDDAGAASEIAFAGQPETALDAAAGLIARRPIDVNILPARVRESGGGSVVLDSAISPAPFTVASDTAPATGSEAWLAVRPEKIDIELGASTEAAANTLSGTVTDIGYLGDLSLYRVTLDDGTVVRASLTNARRVVDRRITWDDRVHLSWAPEAGVLLTS